jgi:hypothetical protein
MELELGLKRKCFLKFSRKAKIKRNFAKFRFTKIFAKIFVFAEIFAKIENFRENL